MNMSTNDSRYEGCGEEGPLRNIFLAEFHHITGPMIRCQAPKNGESISKDLFDAISVYIIPKQQLARRTMTVNVLSHKISGYPIIIDNKKYKRNQLMFNLCFVCHPWSRTAQYEPALIKLSEFLVNLELENEFLSSADDNSDCLQAVLEQVFSEMNTKASCKIQIGSSTLQLKVISSRPDPVAVHDYDVPVLMIDPRICKSKWDLTTQQLLPYMNGRKHVARIAAEADVEASLVRAAIQSLVYHRVVKLVSIFQYSNVYCVTPELRVLRENLAIREEILDNIMPNENVKCETRPTFRDIYEIICAFTHGTTVKDLCLRYRPREKYGIDMCKFTTVLQLKGILRRVHMYPVFTPTESAGSQGCFNGHGKNCNGFSRQTFDFNGSRHFDEICCKTGHTAARLDEIIENDPDVLILRK